MKDAIHALQDGIADSIGKVGDLAGKPLLLWPIVARLVMMLQSRIDAGWTCEMLMCACGQVCHAACHCVVCGYE